MQIQYKRAPRWQRFFTMVCTLGFASFVVRLAMRSWPAVLDEQGIQLRNGTKVEWVECKTFTNPIGRTENSTAERLLLLSDRRNVPFNFDQMVDPEQVREFLRDQLLEGFEVVDEVDEKIDDGLPAETTLVVEPPPLKPLEQAAGKEEKSEPFELLEPGSEESG